MLLLYIFLIGVFFYCLFQSLRYRMATWKHKKVIPDFGRMTDAVVRDSDAAMEDAFLTEEGRKLNFRHRVYEFVGFLAAIAFALLWLSERGII